ncbi:hypothetical protein BDN72DRAFT_965973 [Pluteus cervinus]|uniref:Uncharacterized protein n=1 Tax=Pluteus cervinus TaxID=181527 RepID=A0ACD3A1E5_9AGAR|nr:hypothetical protein BDN72DRAFT_965973 [Pluteus cervinus]
MASVPPPITPKMQEIDKKIARLSDSEQIRVLKSKRNSLVPISSLQPELLLSIFFALQSRYIVGPEKYYRWMVVTHVSRSWRNLALDTSSLWSGIVQAKKSQQVFAEVSFQRSGSSDLDIFFGGCGLDKSLPNLKLFLSNVTDNLPRIRSLKIQFWSGVKAHNLIACLAQPLPLLNSLTLSTSPEVGADYMNTAGSVIAPNLHSLSLFNIQLHLPWSVYSGIIHLELKNGDDDRVAFTLSSLVMILKHTTKLRTLKLDWYHPSRTGGEHVDGPIYLPTLSNLTLYALKRNDLVGILSAIEIPLTTTIDVTGPPLDNFLEVLSRCFLSGKREIRRFDYTVRNQLGIRLWDVGQEISLTKSAHLSYFTFCKGTDWIPGFMASTWVSLSQLHEARLLGSRIPDVHIDRHPSLFSALGSTPLLELFLTESFVAEVAEYIANHPESFPELETLTVHEITISTETLGRLCTALENRADYGIGRLKKLVLYSKRVENQAWNNALKRLKNTVSDVTLVDVKGRPEFYRR